MIKRLRLLSVFLVSMALFICPVLQAKGMKPHRPDNGSLAAKYRPMLMERFLKYTTYDSQSSNDADITPEQIETAKKLYAEIKPLGFPTTLTEHYYIYVEIASNVPYPTPVLGFSSHYDTTPDIAGKNIKANVIKNYDGKPHEEK